MKRIYLSELRDTEYLRGSMPDKEHCQIKLNEPAQVYVNRQLKLQYFPVTFDYSKYIEVLHSLPYRSESTFIEGTEKIKIKHKSDFFFGFCPENEIREIQYGEQPIKNDDPYAHLAFVQLAQWICRCYRRSEPERYLAQAKQVHERIPLEAFMHETLFNMGIVSNANAMVYHKDSKQFPNSFAGLVVFKNEMEGGHLLFPSLNLYCPFDTPGLVLYKANELMHGVSDLKKKSHDLSYRYSILYYANRGLERNDYIKN